jgi:hypothetical protein
LLLSATARADNRELNGRKPRAAWQRSDHHVSPTAFLIASSNA